jgi:protein involved in polysaccharide export with SLBB domain
VVALALAGSALAASAFGRSAGAQGTPGVVTRASAEGASATRAGLTAALAAAERRGDRAASAAIRQRLTEGDVGPGDRLAVTLALDTVSRQELVVRDSQRVDVLPLGSFSLRGVLRSELPDAFRRFYLQYYRNPEVRVQTLVRVGFLGAVQKPGYYTVAPDAPIADAFTASAGGPAGNADPKKIEVKRAGRRLLDRKGYERVAREGLTFDEAGLRSGDEVHVGERKSRNTGQIIQTSVFALSALISLVFLIRSAYGN